MFKDSKAFSSFSTNDPKATKKFYEEVLGLEVKVDLNMGMLTIEFKNGTTVMIYPKGIHHAPANFTVLNFPVKKIDEAVDALIEKGVEFEHYDNEYIKTDKKGISRDPEGPQVAWFKDPAGNILAVMQIPSEK